MCVRPTLNVADPPSAEGKRRVLSKLSSGLQWFQA